MPNTEDILVDTLISWDVEFVFGLQPARSSHRRRSP